jgi:hypothetical protein
LTAHPHHFETARRATELLLRVQAASPAPVDLQPLAGEWGVSWQTVRRIVTTVEQQAEDFHQLGRLVRSGRGKTARLAWVPRACRSGRRARSTQLGALLAAIGPWRAAGAEGVASVLQQLLQAAVADSGEGRAGVVADLLRRGFYHQPHMPRAMRDPEALDEVLSSLFWRRGLWIERYHSPRREHHQVVIEPWTLVHALDGLYVLGPLAGEAKPWMWALHRMEGVRWQREHHVEVPADYRPEDLLGHGYGPFLGEKGETLLRVPAEHAPWVLESPLPCQQGEPEPLHDGGFRVRLGIARNYGLEMWARGMGVEIWSDQASS